MPTSMNGKNCSGRLVSLLDDNIAHQPRIIRPPSTASSMRTETSNNTLSPVGLAAIPTQAPLLSKSELAFQYFSSQKWDSRLPQHIFLPQHKNYKSMHPPGLQPSGTLSLYRTRGNSQVACFDLKRAPEQQSRTVDAWPKEKRHPCPVARQYNCGSTFTTSGQASRHAKRHTGQKDALCAECNRTFARKDNMEQHRHTHHSGSGVGKGDGTIAKKTKCLRKQRKAIPIQSLVPLLLSLPLSILPFILIM